VFPEILLLAALGAACGAASRPMLAEVLYDPAGEDAGREFVEIYNPTPAAVPLAGLRLEAGDGAAPARWTLRWTAGPADTLAPGGRFVVGGARVLPLPDAVVTLDLQNGPDAVRLVWPDQTLEVVGYGALEHDEYACGEPAPDVSGRSLARMPDDARLGSNALDFQPAEPSPGRANLPGVDAAWIAGGIGLFPERPALGEPVLFEGRVTNRGREPIAPGALVVSGVASGSAGPRALFAQPLDAAIAPGETLRFQLALDPLPEGKQRVRAWLDLAEDEARWNDADSAWIRVGESPLTIEEIQFHPAQAEGEWIEVANAARAPLPIDAFTLSDRTGTRGRPEPGHAPCPAESLVVLAQDRRALLGRFPALDTSRVFQVTPWPSLNNANDASGTADQVALHDGDGVLCERRGYSAAGVPAGATLERRGGAWGPSAAPFGTPLAAPPALPALDGAFDLAPRRITRARPSARLAWSLPWPRARVAADLYSLAGDKVAAALPEALAGARGERHWRPDGIAPGVYVLVFRARPEAGGEGLSVRRVLRLDRAAP
jgi:hypothetical protein